ncbi:hypothetical protein WMF37_38145 [Sorangium sp. So ce291]|uniref:hypothetical protein n=1 Tax=Sorangium sp. So ce291 TaxID=3133294 RepID=UPI003F600427
MNRFAHLKLELASLTLAAGAALAASAAACGDSASPARPPQSTLEVYARLDATGVGGITQMPDGRVISGFHPFYTPKVQAELLNPDRMSTTPYPSTEWQSWPDGVYNSDGAMYTGAAQLPLTSALQADGVAKNKPPYLVYRFKPLAPGTPGF